MEAVPRRVSDYWDEVFLLRGGRHGAMILERHDGVVRLAAGPAQGTRIDLAGMPPDIAEHRLRASGVSFHDPDLLFYLPVDAPLFLPVAGPPGGGTGSLRHPREADRIAFDGFHAEASEQDKEDAWVEFDHWAVFGSFEGHRLVSAASLVRWSDGPIADLGVLTLPDARGKGHARAVVGAIARFARSQGRESQYRCQVDNHASIALARACGFVPFGRWTVAGSGADGGA